MKQVKVSVNSTNKQVKGQKYPSPQGNQVGPEKKSQGEKPQFDKIYQHHYNKNKDTKNQVQQYHLPQLHQIKQPQQIGQPPEPFDEEKITDGQQNFFTKRKQQKEDLREDEDQKEEEKKEKTKYENEKTRVGYYPDPKQDSLSRSR